jgi:hypothetical protein
VLRDGKCVESKASEIRLHEVTQTLGLSSKSKVTEGVPNNTSDSVKSFFS